MAASNWEGYTPEQAKEVLDKIASVLRKDKDLATKAVIVLATNETGRYTVGHSADETLPPKERSDVCMFMMLAATASMMKYVVGADLLVRRKDGTIVEISKENGKPDDLSKIMH